MRKAISLSMRLGVVLALGLSLATAVHADRRVTSGKARASELRTFAFSSDFTGVLQGDLLIDGTLYRVAPKASVYVLGQGLAPAGLVLSHRSIYVSGVYVGNEPVVRSIIVRPSSNRAGAGEAKITVRQFDDVVPL